MKHLLSLLLIAGTGTIAILLSLFAPNHNEISNNLVHWSMEWQTVKTKNGVIKKTLYSGSEIDFTFANVKKFTISGSATNKDDDTSLVVFLDKQSIRIPIKEIKKGYEFKAFSDSKKHTFRMIFYCRGWFSPCNVSLSKISIDGGNISAPTKNYKVVGMLGDSISLLYAKDNYSSLLAQKINYQLHNASIWGRSLSHTGKIAPAIQYVNKDFIPYKPNLVILNLGTNDILDSVKESDFTSDYKRLIAMLQTSLPESTVVVVSIMPGKTHQLEKITDNWNKDIQQVLPKNIFYADVTKLLKPEDYLDAIHPNQQGQKKLANYLYQYLVEHKLL